MIKTSLLAAAVVLSTTFTFAGELEQAPAPVRSAIASAAPSASMTGQINVLLAAASIPPLTEAQFSELAAQSAQALQMTRLYAADEAAKAIAAPGGLERLQSAAGPAAARIRGLADLIAGSASEQDKAQAGYFFHVVAGAPGRSAAALDSLKTRLGSGDDKASLDSFFDSAAGRSESDVAGSLSSERLTLTRAKRVENLEAMAKKNPRLGLSYIKAVVDDPEERGAEVLISALRLLSPMSPDWTSSFLSHVVEGSSHYYLRREAAKMLGAMGPSLTEVSKKEALAALKKAASAEEAPTRLMARDVLSKWGVDPGPEAVPQAKNVETEKILTPEEIKAAEEQAAADKLAAELAARPWWKKAADAVAGSMKAYPAVWTALPALLIGLGIYKIWGGLPAVAYAAIAGLALSVFHHIAQSNKPVQQRPDEIIAGALRDFKMRQVSGSKGFEPVSERPTTRFEDVAGIDEARMEIEELKDFLNHPEDFAYYGAQMPRGALLVGPPGTGKTLLARALAGEAGVPFYAQSGSDFVEQYVGVGASRVRVLFKKAGEHAPAIIFIDEIDSIGGARGDQDNSEWLGTLTAMLTELDGFDPSKGVLLIGATNRLDSLDPALRRRFDRIIYVGQPDVMGREAILQVHAKSRRIGPDVDLHKVAKNTAGLSGSYLAKIVNEAAILSARRNKGLARDKMGPITQTDFDEAIEKITVGTKHSQIMSAADKKRLARHEAGHQVLRLLLEGKASTVTMIPRGHEGAAGYSRKEGEEEDRIGQTSSELSDDIVIAFGGRVAEEQAFGDFSTGVSGDMAGATNVARAMVEQMGMGKRTRFGSTITNGRESARQSEAFKAKIDDDIQDIKEQAYERAKALLNEPENKAAVERLEAALLERETLSGEQSAEIANIKPLGK